MEHALPFHRCTTADVFTISGDDAAGIIPKIDKYLSAFVAPTKDEGGKTSCFHCGTSMDGLLAALGGGAAYEWGLCHGEARCSKCGWPARGMHYPKDEDGSEIFSARNLFLAYHPDQVSSKDEQEAA